MDKQLSRIVIDGDEIEGDLVLVSGLASLIEDIVVAGAHETLVIPGHNGQGLEIKRIVHVGPTTTFSAVLVDDPAEGLRDIVFTPLVGNLDVLLRKYSPTEQ